MIKVVFFDLDGVLTTDKTGSQSVLKYLCGSTGLPFEILRAAYYRHNKELLSGRQTHAEIWKTFCAEVGAEIDYGLLGVAFRNTPMDEKMLALARELKRRGITIGMITDNKCDRVDAILEHYGLRELFDIVVVSAAHGCTKDQRGIFEISVTQAKVAFHECIFIDNSPKNLVAARELGMHVLHFDDELRDYILLKDQIENIL